jgi:hypothetical protein
MSVDPAPLEMGPLDCGAAGDCRTLSDDRHAAAAAAADGAAEHAAAATRDAWRGVVIVPHRLKDELALVDDALRLLCDVPVGSHATAEPALHLGFMADALAVGGGTLGALLASVLLWRRRAVERIVDRTLPLLSPWLRHLVVRAAHVVAPAAIGWSVGQLLHAGGRMEDVQRLSTL